MSLIWFIFCLKIGCVCIYNFWVKSCKLLVSYWFQTKDFDYFPIEFYFVQYQGIFFIYQITRVIYSCLLYLMKRKFKLVVKNSTNINKTYNHLSPNINKTYNHLSPNINKTYNHLSPNINKTYNHLSPNINKTYNYLAPLLIEHKKKPTAYDAGIHVCPGLGQEQKCGRVKPVFKTGRIMVYHCPSVRFTCCALT